jgi:quinol monooxygenase YgiN
MIQAIIRMKVHSEKRLELSQTITLLGGSIRMEKGCRRYDFCQNVEKENEHYLLEEWDSQEDLKKHLKSDHFRVLRGAMNFLQEPYEIMFNTLSYPVKLERFNGEIAFTELQSS